MRDCERGYTEEKNSVVIANSEYNYPDVMVLSIYNTITFMVM